jgi:hypothetical protein
MFLNTLNTPGGHIFLCCLLGLIGVAVALRGHDMAAASLLGFLTAAAALMRGNGKGDTS